MVDRIDSSAIPVLCLIMSGLHSDMHSDTPMGPFRIIKARNKSNLGISSGEKNGKNNEWQNY